MIEEALLKSNYIGKDGFSWWIGQVAKKDTWEKGSQFSNQGDWAARCKVRIVGYHSFDGDVLGDEDLPWAQIMLDPSFGSAQGGIGGTINLKGGETCFGFFLDGDDGQQPVVIGLLYRSDGVKNLQTEDVVKKEKSSRFKPFTGHPGNNPPSTQRNIRGEKEIDQADPKNSPKETTPVPKDLVNLAYTTDLGFNIGGVPVTPQLGDKIAGIFKDIPASSTNAIGAAFTRQPAFIKPNGCQKNLIGQITQGLQDFIAVTNGLDQYLGAFIDPVLNEIVDIGQSIANCARQIGGIIKLIINNLRNTIFKCIAWAFRKLVGLIVPPPQQTIVLEVMKKILDVIFCLLERLPGGIIDYIQGLLGDLAANTINAPVCAVEKWTASILAKVMDSIENALSAIMSGIGWLTGGLSTVSGILNQASSLASQIFSFLECTGLACKTPSVWAANFGPSEKEVDDWQKMVDDVNVFKGINSGLSEISAELETTNPGYAEDLFGKFGSLVDNAIYYSSPLYETINKVLGFSKSITILSPGTGYKTSDKIIVNGNIILTPLTVDGKGGVISIPNLNTITIEKNNPPSIIIETQTGSGLQLQLDIKTFYETTTFDECGQKVTNPTTQEDILPLPVGSKYKRCIPPIARIVGDGFGARATPIVDKNGSIISFYINSGGALYTKATVVVVDNTGHGTGAYAKAIIKEGSISSIYLTDYGSGYCPGNYTNLFDPNNPGITTSINLTSTKYSINEGDSFDINTTSKNILDDTLVKYEITGISNKAISQSLTGNLTVKDNKSSITIDTFKDIIDSSKVLKFSLPEYNKSVEIFVNKLNKPQTGKQQYYLTSTKSVITEGQSFVVNLVTQNVENDTIVPYTITGITDGLLKNQSLSGAFTILNNQSKINIDTNEGIIKDSEIFKLSLNNKLSSVSVLINPINDPEKPKPGISSDVSACVQDIIVTAPGYGYTTGDTITDGKNTYTPIVTPGSGAIIGIQPLTNPICGFDVAPTLTINTRTGVAANVVPLMKFTQSYNTVEQANQATAISGIVTSVIDCV
jgi:hypothetical protein